MSGPTAAKAEQERAGGKTDDRTREASPRPTHAPAQTSIVALQQSAGNQAVSGLVDAGIPPVVRSVIGGAGQPMEPAVREHMEARFGEDFGPVRVHTDARAAESAESVSAKAYTVGRDVVFGPGRYAPESGEGRRLLAHELAHVVQQGRGGTVPTVDQTNALDSAADQAADSALSGAGPVAVTGASAVGIAREPKFHNTEPKYSEGTLLMTVQLPLGTAKPPRAGFEEDFHGYLPPSIQEDADRWHASHSVGPIVGKEKEEGILLAPRGVNLSIQKNLENHINGIRAARGAKEGSKLFLKIEASAHPGTRRLSNINYELWAVDPDGQSGVMLTASVSVSNELNPTVNVQVGGIRGGSLEGQAGRTYKDAFSIRKEGKTSTEEAKKQPLRPRSSDPATYSSSASVTKRHPVPNPEVVTVRPKPAGGPSATPPSKAGTTTPPVPPAAPAGTVATPPKTPVTGTPGTTAPAATAPGATTPAGPSKALPSSPATAAAPAPKAAAPPVTTAPAPKTVAPPATGRAPVRTVAPSGGAPLVAGARPPAFATQAGVAVGGLAVRMLLQYLVSSVQESVAAEQFDRDYEKNVRPKLSTSLAELSGEIHRRQVEAPGTRLYVNVTIRSMTMTDVSGAEQGTTFLGVELLGVTLSTENVNSSSASSKFTHLGMVSTDTTTSTFSLPVDPIPHAELVAYAEANHLSTDALRAYALRQQEAAAAAQKAEERRKQAKLDEARAAQKAGPGGEARVPQPVLPAPGFAPAAPQLGPFFQTQAQTIPERANHAADIAEAWHAELIREAAGIMQKPSGNARDADIAAFRTKRGEYAKALDRAIEEFRKAGAPEFGATGLERLKALRDHVNNRDRTALLG